MSDEPQRRTRVKARIKGWRRPAEESRGNKPGLYEWKTSRFREGPWQMVVATRSAS
ncbi:hypothetical protein D3C72_2370990 [compost metagenome]